MECEIRLDRYNHTYNLWVYKYKIKIGKDKRYSVYTCRCNGSE